ncbi:MAG: hypothetical protein ACOY0T_24570 [Myxococcota bacterium]
MYLKFQRSRACVALGLSLLILACTRPPTETPAQTVPTTSTSAPRAPEVTTPLPVTSRVSAKSYRCNLVVGLAVTAEWFEAGFEEIVGNGRWQALVRPHTFVADWADPGHPAWSEPLRSACDEAHNQPERVLFFAADWNYKNENEWITGLTATVNAVRARYPSAREIQLLTMVRAPGNTSCGNAKSVVEPFVDQAMERVSAQFDGLVRVGPKFEVASCDWFEKGGPHFTESGRREVARLIGEHYGDDL